MKELEWLDWNGSRTTHQYPARLRQVRPSSLDGTKRCPNLGRRWTEKAGDALHEALNMPGPSVGPSAEPALGTVFQTRIRAPSPNRTRHRPSKSATAGSSPCRGNSKELSAQLRGWRKGHRWAALASTSIPRLGRRSARAPRTSRQRVRDWILVSEDSMIGMVRTREIAAERRLVPDPEALQWTGRIDQPAADS